MVKRSAILLVGTMFEVEIQGERLEGVPSCRLQNSPKSAYKAHD